MRTSRRPLAALLTGLGLALASCGSSRPAAEPLPPGAGLLSADLEAPSGAAQFERPSLAVGDWFDYRRGGLLRLRYLVRESPAGIELFDPDSGRTLVMDDQLCQLGERATGADGFQVQLDPVDPSYAWPLWVGKRWSGSFTRRGADGLEIPLLVYYVVEARETVQVPAGEFETLRIARRVSPALEGEYVDRTSIAWFAPSVGQVVKRLDDGVATELEGYHRQ